MRQNPAPTRPSSFLLFEDILPGHYPATLQSKNRRLELTLKLKLFAFRFGRSSEEGAEFWRLELLRCINQIFDLLTLYKLH